MASPADLHNLALAYLSVCADALNTIPLLTSETPALLGAPVRSYVSPGLPVFDCPEMLVVQVAPINEGDTTPGGLDAGRRAARFARINQVALIGTAIRCVPTGVESNTGSYSPPDVTELELAAKQINADGWALWNHLFNAVHAEQLLTLCDEVTFVGITPVIPSGGSAGWSVTARASLGGYEELLGS